MILLKINSFFLFFLDFLRYSTPIRSSCKTFLIIKINTSGVITLSELDWITNHQSEFSRLDMALVIKIGRLMDSGVVEIDNRLPV